MRTGRVSGRMIIGSVWFIAAALTVSAAPPEAEKVAAVKTQASSELNIEKQVLGMLNKGNAADRERALAWCDAVISGEQPELLVTTQVPARSGRAPEEIGSS